VSELKLYDGFYFSTSINISSAEFNYKYIHLILKALVILLISISGHQIPFNNIGTRMNLVSFIKLFVLDCIIKMVVMFDI